MVIFVSGDRDPSCVVEWCTDFRDDGAFNSHRCFDWLFIISISIGLSWTVESATPTIDCVWLGRKIGTKADFTTSICSSSESSDEIPLFEWISTDVFILIDILWPDDGGLDDDGRDETGDTLDVFKCSGDVVPVAAATAAATDAGFDGCVKWNVRPFETARKFAKSYGKNGFLLRKSGCPKWNGGRYVAADGGINAPGGGIILACEPGSIGWDPGCSELKSALKFDARTVGGTAPDNVGETAKMKKIY